MKKSILFISLVFLTTFSFAAYAEIKKSNSIMLKKPLRLSKEQMVEIRKEVESAGLKNLEFNITVKCSSDSNKSKDIDCRALVIDPQQSVE